MNEKFKKAFEFLSSDDAYTEKLLKINEEYPDFDENKIRVIALAKEAGFELSEEDFDMDIPVEELDSVAGGRINVTNGDSDCNCLVGGGGTKDEYQKTCACVAYGQGDMTDAGKAHFHKDVAMRCFVGGGKWD